MLLVVVVALFRGLGKIIDSSEYTFVLRGSSKCRAATNAFFSNFVRGPRWVVAAGRTLPTLQLKS